MNKNAETIKNTSEALAELCKESEDALITLALVKCDDETADLVGTISGEGKYVILVFDKIVDNLADLFKMSSEDFLKAYMMQRIMSKHDTDTNE